VIEGYYVAETAEVPATYISPLNGFLDMTSLSDKNNPNSAFTDFDKATGDIKIRVTQTK
jgi:hypothetical protein